MWLFGCMIHFCSRVTHRRFGHMTLFWSRHTVIVWFIYFNVWGFDNTIHQCGHVIPFTCDFLHFFFVEHVVSWFSDRNNNILFTCVILGSNMRCEHGMLLEWWCAEKPGCDFSECSRKEAKRKSEMWCNFLFPLS